RPHDRAVVLRDEHAGCPGPGGFSARHDQARPAALGSEGEAPTRNRDFFRPLRPCRCGPAPPPAAPDTALENAPFLYAARYNTRTIGDFFPARAAMSARVAPDAALEHAPPLYDARYNPRIIEVFPAPCGHVGAGPPGTRAPSQLTLWRLRLPGSEK